MNKIIKKISYITLLGLVFSAFYFQIRSYKYCKKKCVKTYNMYSLYKGIYPKSHWLYRISKSCMNCLHRSFITRHWGEGGLFCENCKKLHKGKIAKHYLYDEAIKCMKCGHKNIPKNHDESNINCTKCKMGHYDHYSKNVLIKEEFK